MKAKSPPVRSPEPTTDEPFAALVGLDWSDRKHDYYLYLPGPQTLITGEFAQTPEAIDAWVRQVREQGGDGPIAVAIETSRGPLIYALMKYPEVVIFPINPKALARYREALHPTGPKDDPSDAALALDLLRKHRDQLRPWQPDDAATRQLALLVEHRRQWVGHCTAVTNQLQAALKNYFPQALALLEDQLDTRLAADFLRKWPTLAALQRSTAHLRRKFFYGHNCRSSERMAKREQLLAQAQPLTTDPAIIAAYSLQVQHLASQLAELVSTLNEYDHQIAQLFAAHPLAPLFTGLPGAAKVLSPRLLVAFGSQRDRYSEGDSLSTYSGTAPVVVRSGKSKQVHWRRSRPKFLHQTFVEFAQHSVKKCPWARCYFEYHEAKGQSSWSIYRRLAIRWQRILWKCVQTNTPYQESRYLAALKQKPRDVYAKLDDHIALMAANKN